MNKEEVFVALDCYSRSFMGVADEVVEFIEKNNLEDGDFIICADKSGYELHIWTVFY
jgi:hypothetical protein